MGKGGEGGIKTKGDEGGRGWGVRAPQRRGTVGRFRRGRVPDSKREAGAEIGIWDPSSWKRSGIRVFLFPTVKNARNRNI